MNGIQDITAQTVEQVAKTILDGGLSKAISVSNPAATGLTGVNLEAPAKQLVPLLTRMYGMIPRKNRSGSNASQWKAITGLTSPKPTVNESAASAQFTTTVAAKSATFKSFGVRGTVTREAVAASNGFDNALAKETANALLLGMKLQEQYFLGGNVTAFGAAPTGSAIAKATTAGSLGNATYYMRVQALTLPAAMRVNIARPAAINANSENMYDPTGKGYAAWASTDGIGALATEVNSGAITGSIALKCSWNASIPGACAYAVYVGTSTGDANLLLQAVTTQTQITLSTILTTGTIAANDASVSTANSNTADALAFDGMIPQILAGGGYTLPLGGKLTTSGGDVVQFQDALAALWDQAKIGKYLIACAGQESRSLAALQSGLTNSPQVQMPPGGVNVANVAAGYHVSTIVNTTTGDLCPVEVMPWMPGGSVLFIPLEIPYPDANADAAFDYAYGFDWERWDYGSTASSGPVYDFEVRTYGVLRGVYTGGCGYVYNIWRT